MIDHGLQTFKDLFILDRLSNVHVVGGATPALVSPLAFLLRGIGVP
jgi:hypothetical protein